jgi:hypothetical protein
MGIVLFPDCASSAFPASSQANAFATEPNRFLVGAASFQTASHKTNPPGKKGIRLCISLSLNSNATSSLNTAIGRRALQFHTDGDYNTAAGYNALANGATGNYNSAFGTYAFYFNTADGNVAVGYTHYFKILPAPATLPRATRPSRQTEQPATIRPMGTKLLT